MCAPKIMLVEQGKWDVMGQNFIFDLGMFYIKFDMI